MRHTLAMRGIVEHVETPERRATAEHFLKQFEAQVVPLFSSLPQSIIHHDANDYNVLVGDSDSGSRRVTGLIGSAAPLSSARSG